MAVAAVCDAVACVVVCVYEVVAAAKAAEALVAVAQTAFDKEKPEKLRGSTKLTSGFRKTDPMLRMIDISYLS